MAICSAGALFQGRPCHSAPPPKHLELSGTAVALPTTFKCLPKQPPSPHCPLCSLSSGRARGHCNPGAAPLKYVATAVGPAASGRRREIVCRGANEDDPHSDRRGPGPPEGQEPREMGPHGGNSGSSAPPPRRGRPRKAMAGEEDAAGTTPGDNTAAKPAKPRAPRTPRASAAGITPNGAPPKPRRRTKKADAEPLSPRDSGMFDALVASRHVTNGVPFAAPRRPEEEPQAARPNSGGPAPAPAAAAPLDTPPTPPSATGAAGASWGAQEMGQLAGSREGGVGSFGGMEARAGFLLQAGAIAGRGETHTQPAQEALSAGGGGGAPPRNEGAPPVDPRKLAAQKAAVLRDRMRQREAQRADSGSNLGLTAPLLPPPKGADARPEWAGTPGPPHDGSTAPPRPPPAPPRPPSERAGSALLSEQSMATLSTDNQELVRRILEKQEEIEGMAKRERELQDGFKQETEQELDRIKSSLKSREQDLKSMARELADAKAQFAMMREKAVAEVARAERLVAEKDAELKGIQQAIVHLKLVKVEYWGAAERVQLAGSFNGWQQFVDMHPDLTSHIPPPGGGRGPMLWETELWLYPGVYEVKFIVDDKWQVDPRRELVMNNLGQNNLLAVDASEAGVD